MSYSNDVNLELIPITKSNSLQQRRESFATRGESDETDEHRERLDSETAATYGSALLAVPSDGRRRRVLPRVRERLRVESQKIKDKSRRWKEQKAQQRILLDSTTGRIEGRGIAGGGGCEERFSSVSRKADGQTKSGRLRLIDSQFDITDVGNALERGKTNRVLPSRGNDLLGNVEKDGRKKSDMSIHFDNEDDQYETGDVISGYVNITLTQDVRVKDLRLQFNGVGRVSWGEQRSYTKGSSSTVHLKNSEVFLDSSISLLKKDSPTRANIRRPSSAVPLLSSGETTEDGVGLFLPAGIHNYPFEFHLPTDVSGSYEGRWGQIRFWAKATLVRPWKFDIEREKEFTLKSLIDLNEEPELARPIGALGEVSPGLMCLRNGAVTVELRIGRRGYVPGENIQFYIEVENNSRKKLQNISVSLVQHVTFRAGKKMRKSSTNVVSLEKGETLPNTTTVWNTDNLLIPTSPSSSFKFYKGIQIKYTVTVLIKYSSWSDEFCLSVPIVLGTTGLRRQTINTYLSMLGYGQTPRGSPTSIRRLSSGQTVNGAPRGYNRQNLTASSVASVRNSSISSLQSVSASRQRRVSPAAHHRGRTREMALASSGTDGGGGSYSDVTNGGMGSGNGHNAAVVRRGRARTESDCSRSGKFAELRSRSKSEESYELEDDAIEEEADDLKDRRTTTVK